MSGNESTSNTINVDAPGRSGFNYDRYIILQICLLVIGAFCVLVSGIFFRL